MGQSIKSQMPVSNREQWWHSAPPLCSQLILTCHPEGSFRNTNLILPLFPFLLPTAATLTFQLLLEHSERSLGLCTGCQLSLAPLPCLQGLFLHPTQVSAENHGKEKSISSWLPPSLSYTLPCFIIHNHYNNLIVYHLFICMNPGCYNSYEGNDKNKVNVREWWGSHEKCFHLPVFSASYWSKVKDNANPQGERCQAEAGSQCREFPGTFWA